MANKEPRSGFYVGKSVNHLAYSTHSTHTPDGIPCAGWCVEAKTLCGKPVAEEKIGPHDTDKPVCKNCGRVAKKWWHVTWDEEE
jgi:hypothetical protein